MTRKNLHFDVLELLHPTFTFNNWRNDDLHDSRSLTGRKTQILNLIQRRKSSWGVGKCPPPPSCILSNTGPDWCGGGDFSPGKTQYTHILFIYICIVGILIMFATRKGSLFSWLGSGVHDGVSIWCATHRAPSLRRPSMGWSPEYPHIVESKIKIAPSLCGGCQYAH